MSVPPPHTEIQGIPTKAQSIINAWQSNLLDLSRGNRLLKFRATRSTVPIIAPDPMTIFEWLIVEEHKLPICAVALDSVDNLATPVEKPVGESSSPSPSKPALTSAYEPERLAKALYNLRQRARSSVEERGVNILHVALGFVTWHDTTEAGGEWRAPLVLIPVTLERISPTRYVLNALDEDVVLNPTLIYKLEHDHGIHLPDSPDDWEGFCFENFLDQLARDLKELQGATLTRDVVLGLFSFLKIPMYQDLARYTDLMQEHPLVARLVGLPVSAPVSEALNIPSDLDRILDPRSTFQILDADSSQQEALYVARQGRHLLVQGPPGTGKSQTITNLIGECLAEGKKVLFVSEKAAALEVVKRNLDQCGIGDACLELHSHKIDKKKVLTDLQRVLEANAPMTPAYALDVQNALRRTRDELNAYVDALHQPRFALNKSVYEVYGLFENVRMAPEADLRILEIEALTETIFKEQCSCLEALATHRQVIEKRAKHPWRGLAKRAPSRAFVNEMRLNLESLRSTACNLKSIIES